MTSMTQAWKYLSMTSTIQAWKHANEFYDTSPITHANDFYQQRSEKLVPSINAPTVMDTVEK